MVILKRVYAATKPPDVGATVDRVADAFASVGEPDAPIDFVLLDNPFNARSPVDTLVKAYPSFKPFVVDGADVGPTAVRTRVVTSLLPANAALAPIPAALLREVARGIPRRFAFRSANFVWRTPRLGDEVQGPPSPRTAQALTVPGIMVQSPGSVSVSSYAFPGSTRKITLTATIFSEEDVTKSSQLDESARELLDALGAKGRDVVQRLYDSAQQAELRERAAALAPAFERGKAVFDARLETLELVPLAADAPATGVDFQVAEPVRAALRPLGYKAGPSAGHGTILVQKTRADYRLAVYVDRGTWSQNFHAMWILNRPGFSKRIILPLAADGRTRTKQVSDDNIRAICANLATVVAAAEASVFGELPQVETA
jgi:hypothetical protein